MDGSPEKSKYWNNTQAYTMAVICMVLGIVAGYLLHAPSGVAASPNAGANATAPAAATAAPSPTMPSAADMKRMADKQAAPLLEQLQKDPKNAELLAKIAKAYLAAQQFETARQYYEQSVAAKPDPEVFNELAFVYVKMGDLDKAIALLNHALTIAPKNPSILYNLGFFEWKGKADPKAAITAWQAFLKADPKNPRRAEVEQMMAQAKRHLGMAPGTKTEKPAM